MNKGWTRTFYSVESFGWYAQAGGTQAPYWRAGGSGPGGPTLKAAQDRVKSELQRAVKNGADLTKIKIVIKKTVSVETIEQEFTGEDFTVLMLKTC